MNGNATTSTNIIPDVSAGCSETTVSVGSQINLSANSPRKENLKRQLKLLRGKNRRLQNKVSSSVAENSDSELAGVSSDQFKSLCDKFLNENLAQLVKLHVDLKDRSKKGMRYPKELKTMALTLYFLSPNAYKFMQNILNLPTTRCLRLMTGKWQYSPGPNEFIFSSLKLKVSNLSEMEKYCILSADEMSLKSFLFYSISKDEIVGLHNTDTVQLKPASSALVFMIRSIRGNWKQPISYYFTNSGCSAVELKTIVHDIIKRLQDINLKICLFVSDMGSNFLQFARIEGVTHENPYFVVRDQKIFYMFDVPHLYKSLRNNLLKYDFLFQDKVASWQHIITFYNKDKQQNLRQAKNLTDAHIFPNGFQKMKVKLAVQIFSHTVASSLLTYVSLNALDSSAVGTAEFLEMCNNVFDLLNSSSKVSEKFYARAWIGSEKQLKLFKDFLQLIKSISVKNKENKDITSTIKCFQGFVITINSFLQLWSYLKTQSFSFVLTRRLNQDCLENFFGSLRQQGGNSYNPTPVQFTRAFKKLVCLNYFQHSSSLNCAEEFDVLLSKVNDCSDLLNVGASANTNSKNIVVNCIDYRDNLPGKNALQYVCGYLIKKCLIIHECNTCLAYSQEEANNLDCTTVYSHFKAYENKIMDFFGNLKCPSSSFVSYIEQLENIFTDNILKLMTENNVGYKLIDLMGNICFNHPCKAFPHSYLIKLFVRMRIFYFLKFLNRDLKTRTKKNYKLIKVTHL